MDFESFEQWWKEITKPLDTQPVTPNLFYLQNLEPILKEVPRIYEQTYKPYRTIGNEMLKYVKEKFPNSNKKSSYVPDIYNSYQFNPNNFGSKDNSNLSTNNYIDLIGGKLYI